MYISKCKRYNSRTARVKDCCRIPSNGFDAILKDTAKTLDSENFKILHALCTCISYRYRSVYIPRSQIIDADTRESDSQIVDAESLAGNF